MTDTLGQRLEKTIKASRCKKEGVAMGAGVSLSMLKAYLKDLETPPYGDLVRIAELLGTTPEWLLTGKHPGKTRL